MGKKILVADDDPGILEAIEAMLHFKGYDVITTLDGDNVLEIAGQNAPDLFLLDIWMPGLSGTEICKVLKTDPKTAHIPIILISASLNVAKAATDAGADNYLAKPFEMREMLRKIELLIS
ncbi:response regulator receiver protein [Mucilaginibacter sp. PPCGB 2223]|uniref:response regulator n=1 Tax=Mucilaginibacter sp. PPCGB 2223 TaxID=1886027 RepID=UPI000825D466|nr:response regulator [Mucilaginibacter sp. PPCGB 2223]OCX52645.1 response regulator receiver protein [Mucilaginibacter sp. PPCGB 2223]